MVQGGQKLKEFVVGLWLSNSLLPRHPPSLTYLPLGVLRYHAYSVLKNTNSAFKKELFCYKNLLS